MRTWTKVGEEIVGSPIDEDTILSREFVTRAIQNIEWIEIPKGKSLELPAMPGMGIQQVIETLRVPNVSHIGISNELAPYGLYGLRAHYKNGDAEIYVVDAGSHLTPVCTDFRKKGCGKYTHVAGTNGGTMPCGGFLTDLSGNKARYYCSDACEKEASDGNI